MGQQIWFTKRQRGAYVVNIGARALGFVIPENGKWTAAWYEAYIDDRCRLGGFKTRKAAAKHLLQVRLGQ